MKIGEARVGLEKLSRNVFNMNWMCHMSGVW